MFLTLGEASRFVRELRALNKERFGDDTCFICWPLGIMLFPFLAKASIKANKYLRIPEYTFRLFECGFFQIKRPGKPFKDLSWAKLIYLKHFESLNGAGGRD